MNLEYGTFLSNEAVGGLLVPGTTNGPASGKNVAGASFARISISNTLLANTSRTNDVTSLSGPVEDLGFNLSSDDSAALRADSSKKDTPTKLGVFGFYGGFVPTLPLQEGSPAVDAGSKTIFPSSDARGWPRPVGLGPDIGAFESSISGTNLIPGMLFLAELPGGSHLTMLGRSENTYELQTSLGLSSWTTLAVWSNLNGLATYRDTNVSGRIKYYRAREIRP